ncbi:ABC transporter substrate-binding protein [Ruania zhangjianzhongii]|uniref:ABC transporter substrate-binding protein n=1 Tax=Ruania zhangjianzhongii TaxID=2603206 RepID=UPI00143D8028|nr:ABC transporter substrate-binding protein [Ruania zhangjianzhongii]
MKARTLIAPLAVAALALTACGGEDNTNEEGQYELTVMQITTMDSAPLYLGVEEGIFAEHGLDVTIEIAEAGSAIVPSVVNQESPIGYANAVSDLQAIDQGLDLRFVANCCGVGADPEADTSALFVLPDGPITEVGDLAGANIAVNSVNNLGDLTIDTALANEGVDTSGVTYTPMNYSDMSAALERGDVDAIWSVEPFRSISEETGFVNVIDNFVASFPDTTIGYYITSGPFAEENPEIVASFQEAMSEANEFATENPDRVRETVVRELELDPELVEGANFGVFAPGLDTESLRTIGAAALEAGMISAEPDYDAVVVQPQD